MRYLRPVPAPDIAPAGQLLVQENRALLDDQSARRLQQGIERRMLGAHMQQATIQALEGALGLNLFGNLFFQAAKCRCLSQKLGLEAFANISPLLIIAPMRASPAPYRKA